LFTPRCRRERGAEGKRTLWGVEERHWLGGGGCESPASSQAGGLGYIHTGAGCGLDAGKLKARYSEQGKESIWGGRSAVSGLFPPSGKRSSERRHSFKGQTESNLPVLVFCAIKKTGKNKYNLKTSYTTLKARETFLKYVKHAAHREPPGGPARTRQEGCPCTCVHAAWLTLPAPARPGPKASLWGLGLGGEGF